MPFMRQLLQFKKIIFMVGFPYAAILIFTAFGPVLRHLMPTERMNHISSFFLFVLILSLVTKPSSRFSLEKKRKNLAVLTILTAIILLPFAYYPYPVQWAVVGVLGFTEGRIASHWSRIFLNTVPLTSRGGVIGLVLFLSYGLLYLGNMVFGELPPALLPSFASLLLLVSLPFQKKLMGNTDHQKEWTNETKSMGSKTLLFVFFIIYISAGVTYSGIFPDLVKMGRYYQFWNVLPFVLAVPFIGRLADRHGRDILLFLGMGCLGVSFITFLFPGSVTQYFITEIPLEIGWAFLDAAVWIIGADMADKYRNSQIQLYFVGAFLSGTFVGSLIYVVLMETWGASLFIVLLMAHIPLFLGILILGVVISVKKIELNPAHKEAFSLFEDLLTPREKEIFQILLEDKSNKEICYALNISPNTLKTHIRRIYKKTGVSSRNEFQDFFGT